MNHDIDIKKLRINCFRQSKVAGEFMLQMRVPGSMIAAKYLQVVQDIAENWGHGTFHIGMRQTLNIPGIKYEYIGEVNKYIKDYIKEAMAENNKEMLAVLQTILSLMQAFFPQFNTTPEVVVDRGAIRDIVDNDLGLDAWRAKK